MRIKGLERRNLFPTCYYFRLGYIARVPSSSEGLRTVDLRHDPLIIPPGTVAEVTTREHFELGDNILGLLGNQTRFPMERGLQLLHGPSIDPGYDAPLQLALFNIGGVEARLDYGDLIGKAMFFDISDSALEASRLAEPGEARAERLRQLYKSDN
jgi:deoxycytidine triphosphate deaminase